MTRGPQYRLFVGSGIPADGSYAIFATPVDRPSVEYELDGQFDTSSEALTVAQAYREFLKDHICAGEIEVREPATPVIPPLTAGLSEEALSDAVEKLLAATMGHSSRELTKKDVALRLVRGNLFPYLLCYAAFVVYGFSIDLSVPEWLPLFGDWLGERSFTTSAFAAVFPFVLAVAVAYTTWRTVTQAMRFELLGECVLALALTHNWKRAHFDALFRRFTITSDSPFLVMAVKLHYLGRAHAGAEGRYVDEKRFESEEFGNRIHALYSQRNEGAYDRAICSFSPFFFVLERSRALVRSVRGERPVFLPPGVGQTSPGFAWSAIATRSLILLGACIWSIVLAPPDSAWGWIGSLIAVALAVTLPAAWNYNTIVRHRGYPRAFRFTTDWAALERSVLVL